MTAAEAIEMSVTNNLSQDHNNLVHLPLTTCEEISHYISLKAEGRSCAGTVTCPPEG